MSTCAAPARPRSSLETVILLKETHGRSDTALVQECRNGDAAAFDELVQRYKDRVYNMVYRFVGNREDALEVAQEVFVRAYRGVKSFRGEAKVYTWLYSIAANLARNCLRDRGRKGRDKSRSFEEMEAVAPGALHDAAAVKDTPYTLAAAHELEEVLQQCLQELPDHYRMAFLLRVGEDLTYEEIAEVMGCPEGTVKSRLNQARKILRDRLRELAVL
jgi:RNA polymerase sigma-70 factor, ECF subfamily